MEPDRAVAGACIVLQNLAMMWKVPLVEEGHADDVGDVDIPTYRLRLPLSGRG